MHGADESNEFTRPGAFPAALREFAPEVGLVLGSGLGSLVDRVAIEGRASYREIEGLPVSSVPGHAGQFAWGTLGSARVLVAQGRVHLYEGHRARDVAAGVRAMAAAGVKTLVLTNAAGAVNRAFAPGRWMMLRDHLNLTGHSPLTGGPRFVDMSEAYSKRLREVFAGAAAGRGIDLHEGVYASLPGPQYETPAEVRMLGILGADAVGMSSVIEAIQARALGLEVAGFSCLTNWAAGLGEGALSHEEVIDTGRSAAARLVDVLEAAMGRLLT